MSPSLATVPTWPGPAELRSLRSWAPVSISGRNRESLRLLDLHDLGFFASGQGVDALDLGLGELLQLRLGAFRLILRHLALLLHLVDSVDLVAPHVANRHPRFLGSVANELDVLLATLLGQRRDRDADHLAVAGRVQALIAGSERLLDRTDLALVIDLDHQQTRLRGAYLRQLVERGRRAVVRHHDLVDERRVGPAGSNGRQLGGEMIDRLRHLGLRLAHDRIDHPSAPTRVPMSSPSTTRSMLPASSRLKTTMGTLLSMHRVSAVLSITSMPRFSTSR